MSVSKAWKARERAELTLAAQEEPLAAPDALEFEIRLVDGGQRKEELDVGGAVGSARGDVRLSQPCRDCAQVGHDSSRFE